MVKDNPTRLFAEGRSRNTLKSLDISYSTVRLKELKPLLMMDSLETLVCEGIDRDRFGDCHIPAHIVSISFRNSRINGEILT